MKILLNIALHTFLPICCIFCKINLSYFSFFPLLFAEKRQTTLSPAAEVSDGRRWRLISVGVKREDLSGRAINFRITLSLSSVFPRYVGRLGLHVIQKQLAKKNTPKEKLIFQPSAAFAIKFGELKTFPIRGNLHFARMLEQVTCVSW